MSNWEMNNRGNTKKKGLVSFISFNLILQGTSHCNFQQLVNIFFIKKL